MLLLLLPSQVHRAACTRWCFGCHSHHCFTQPSGLFLACPQVLLSQVHRLRALVLLGRFLDMGAWAVDLALSGKQRVHDLGTATWSVVISLDLSCGSTLLGRFLHMGAWAADPVAAWWGN